MESECFLPIEKELKKKRDLQKDLSLKSLYSKIWRGSFPAVVLHSKKDRDLFYSSYVQTYIQRDIRDLANVGDEMAFLRFLRAAAARTGQLLRLSDLAKDADVASNTAKRWISILEASGIIFLLQPYHSNVTKRMIKTPKLYFLDTGLCSYLTEWTTPETLEAGAMAGSILETWVVGEVLKSYIHSGRKLSIYYYRDKDKKEIDLLILRDGCLYPIEIKKTALPKKDMVKHFSVLEKFPVPIGDGCIICLAEKMIPLTKNIISVPVSFL